MLDNITEASAELPHFYPDLLQSAASRIHVVRASDCGIEIERLRILALILNLVLSLKLLAV